MNKTSALVRALAIGTGLSEAGVRKCLREKRLPANHIIAGRWREVMAQEKGK